MNEIRLTAIISRPVPRQVLQNSWVEYYKYYKKCFMSEKEKEAESRTNSKDGEESKLQQYAQGLFFVQK